MTTSPTPARSVRSGAAPSRAAFVAATAIATLTASLIGATASAAPSAAPAAPSALTAPSAAIPPVSPTPQQISSLGSPVPLTSRVQVAVDAGTDAVALTKLKALLGAHGVTRVDEVAPGSAMMAGLTRIALGAVSRADIKAALTGTTIPATAEGYALRSVAAGANRLVIIGGVDGSGQYYGVQTLRQLFGGTAAKPTIASVSVSDFPSMPLRGTIEGFYGEPWTDAERLDQMDFYGDVKANTYIYSPKDDPYLRAEWRDPYPAAQLATLGSLVKRANDNHVQFTYALSPGVSICYSSTADRDALKAKFTSLYDLGVRSFSIPLDDINYGSWNCAGDEAAYGPSGSKAAATAQASLLNDVQAWLDDHEGTHPLQMVPTEYGDLRDSPYKQEMRAVLDPKVVVMWTGTDVVPPSITNAQAQAIEQLFGRKVFVWDNYPVNDFGGTRGRLLLAPYDKREAGLSESLSGIVANPMNQPYASKVAVFGAADFTWNDTAYRAAQSWPRALSYLVHEDPAAAAAMLVFGDLNHLAPTFGPTPWQPQAPVLASKVADFWATVEAGKPADAVATLRAYADQIAAAPDTITAKAEPGFVADADDWLSATKLWGEALRQQLDAYNARMSGDNATADRLTASSTALATQAAQVQVAPVRNSWGAGPVRIGDGVLDTFLTRLADLTAHPIRVTTGERAVIDANGSFSVPVQVLNQTASPANDISVTLTGPNGVSVSPTALTFPSLAPGATATGTITVSQSGAATAGFVTLTSRTTWTSGTATTTVSGSSQVRASCASAPTRPVGAVADSEETAGEDGRASNAIDGNTATFWHTAWSTSPTPTPPHWISLDLGAAKDVCAVNYLPRQSSANGLIGKYEVYASADGQSWGAPLAQGTMSAGQGQKWVPFATTNARYIKLVALTEQQGNPWTTAAEINVEAK